jgi:ketosteroid isomerase-like protein
VIQASDRVSGATLNNSFQLEQMSEAEAEVWRVIEEWNAAFAANDVERYFSFIDESITVLTASNPYRVEGMPDDRAEFEFGLKTGYSRVRYFEEVAPIVRVFGDTALATYFNRGYYGPEGGGQLAYLKETNVLHRKDGRWRIVHIHVSK